MAPCGFQRFRATKPGSNGPVSWYHGLRTAVETLHRTCVDCGSRRFASILDFTSLLSPSPKTPDQRVCDKYQS